MFGFGKTIEVFPTSYRDGHITFKYPKKIGVGKSVKARLLLAGQDSPTVSMKITEMEESFEDFTGVGLLKERQKRIDEVVFKMALAGVEGACRRATKRVAATIRLRSRQLPNYRGITANVNETGVEINTDGPLTVGVPVTLEFDVPEMVNVAMTAITIWCLEVPNPGGKSSYRVGAEFTESDPRTLDAWSTYYRRILGAEGASVMMKTMGDGEEAGTNYNTQESGRQTSALEKDVVLEQSPPEVTPGTAGPPAFTPPTAGSSPQFTPAPSFAPPSSTGPPAFSPPVPPAGPPAFSPPAPPVGPPAFSPPAPPAGPPAFTPPAPPAGPPAFSPPAPPAGPPVFTPSVGPPPGGRPGIQSTPAGSLSPNPLRLDQPSPPAPPAFQPGSPATPSFGQPSPLQFGAPPGFQPPPPPSAGFTPPPPPPVQPPVAPLGPPERVTPVRMSGSNIMFRCRQGERYPVGSQVKVEMAFQIQGQQKTVEISIKVSGIQQEQDGTHTCIGVVMEDAQRIQVLNQLIS